MPRQRRTFKGEFKLQLVNLYTNGKSRADICPEYEITPSALDRWIKNHQETGSFSAKDNRTEEENELMRLRKENHYKALASIKGNLHNIQMFHTDRGKEFDNKLLSEALETFGIQRSLSTKGCPYDNAVAEAMFKVFKTEFANGAHITSLEQLNLEWNDYVHWFNHIRIHGTLGYLTPVEFKRKAL
ncbi:IS3 family transposase [Niallia taxi]|nr:IS3 family transposase [Niallia taxi]MDE5052939.1 IS3 family transposase [Niallia taxi]